MAVRFSSAAVANYCNGEATCEMPPPDALVAQLGFPRDQCQLVCTDPQASGLSRQALQLINPPYSVANGLLAEPLNTNVRGRCMHHTVFRGVER